MQIDITVQGQDVRVAAAPGTPLGSVLAEAGVAHPELLWLGDRPVHPATPIGAAALRSGARLTAEPAPDPRPGAVALHVVGGPSAGLVLPIGRDRLTIGRDPSCAVQLDDDRVSRRHAEIGIRGSDVVVRDLRSTNGTAVDSAGVGGDAVPVRAGQHITVGESIITVTTAPGRPAALTEAGALMRVTRAPRSRLPLPDTELARPELSLPEPPRRIGWITVLLPAVAGGTIAWIADSPQFLLFALLSPVMAISAFLGDRRHWRRSTRRERAEHARGAAAADERIRAALQSEADSRRACAPGPADVLITALGPGARLWERSRTDSDHLHLRVGTHDTDSVLQLGGGGGGRAGAAGRVHGVPLTVDLRAGPLGVTGPPGPTRALAYWLVAQLAVVHSPADVRLVFVLDPEGRRRWSWARWLPHLGDACLATVGDAASVAAQVQAVIASRRRVAQAGTWHGPWIVLVVDTPEIDALGGVLSDCAAAGVSAICVASERAVLAPVCATTAAVSGDTGSRVSVSGAPGGPVDAVAEGVSRAWCERVSRALAPLVDAAHEDTALPDSCSLAGLLGLGTPTSAAVAARWARSSDVRTRCSA